MSIFGFLLLLLCFFSCYDSLPVNYRNTSMVPERINSEGSIPQQSPTTSFTSLLMSTENQIPCGTAMQWNLANHSTGQSTQIWDYEVEPEGSTFTFNNDTCPTNVEAFRYTHQGDYYIGSTSTMGQEASTSNNLPTSSHSHNSSNDYNGLCLTEHFAMTSNYARLQFPAEADPERMRQDRDKALQRYREKKQRRRYGKTIIYESRKASADAKLRDVKGRFVKATEP